MALIKHHSTTSRSHRRVRVEALQFDPSWVNRLMSQSEKAITQQALSRSGLPDGSIPPPLIRAVRRVWHTELTQCQREYFTLYYQDHMRMREIAAQYGVTECTVSRTLRRARLCLKRFLQDYLEPDGVEADKNTGRKDQTAL